ncbi:5'-flap endonuclease [Neodidymelliopsis sp. IMI 364377]|nr:5'-flap endonuclease [Neodidymelliopsis sp. IMI 364377]
MDGEDEEDRAGDGTVVGGREEGGIVAAKKSGKRTANHKTAVEGDKAKAKPKRMRKVDAEASHDTGTLDPELRLPRSAKSPFFESAETLERPNEPLPDALKLTKSGKPRKPRAKKQKEDKGDAESESKPKKTRVAKSKVVAKVTEALDLDEAVSRRRDWTPPRDTVVESPATHSTGKENRPSAQEARDGVFTHLVSNFAYESPTARVATTSNTAPSGVTKRRRVELIDLPGVQTSARAPSPEKGKAPKKKPRTITDLVTGQYAPKEVDVDAQAVTSDFFSPRASATKVPLNDVTAPGAEPPQKKASRKCSKTRDGSETAEPKPRQRAKKTSTKPPAKLKPVAEKLLSPTSAVLRMSRQEVLFGTSSQLALDESPTTVRQIQRAITESEQEARGMLDFQLDAPPRWPKLQKVQGKRGLWRESTRDSNGSLLVNTESLYIPEPDRTQDVPLLMGHVHEEPSVRSEFVDIDDIVATTAPPITISSDAPTPPRLKSPPRIETQLSRVDAAVDAEFLDIDDFDFAPPPSNQYAGSQGSFADIDGFQSTSLAASRHSPSPKSRASAPIPATAPDALRQPRGRPRKTNAKSAPITSAPPQTRKQSPPHQTPQSFPPTPPNGSGRFVDIEEILDSEDEALEAFSPTPPRTTKPQDSPPLPLVFDRGLSAPARVQGEEAGVLPIVRIHTSRLEWANIKPSICASITTHIRALPPTNDPKKPSWHEKILMYDPIILEDLTAHLNRNTQIRTYRRATQKQIKAYNAQQKMNGDALVGVEQDDQVLVLEKELDVYMVRDWCQEMSICCIHAKESRGRGSARKGFY